VADRGLKNQRRDLVIRSRGATDVSVLGRGWRSPCWEKMSMPNLNKAFMEKGGRYIALYFCVERGFSQGGKS